jgi:hypothetical protein
MKVRSLSRVALLAVLCMLGFGAGAFAQLQSGRIVGSIRDPQGAGIPGATVTVTNVATNIARSVVTDTGNYVVTPVDPGTYNVSAEVPGFQKTVRENLVLTVGQAARVELTLNLASLSTDVHVVAEAPLLNTESATLSQVITNEQIVDLPLNGRGFHELARLTSGVALLPPTGNVQTVRPGKRQRQRHRRRPRRPDPVPPRRRRYHRRAPGRHLDPDLGRCAAGVQRAAERVLGRVPRRRRDVQRDDQVWRQRVSREHLRVLSERRVRCEELLRDQQRKARAESVRRHARRPGDSQQDVLLRQLRGAAAAAGERRRQHRAQRGPAARRFRRAESDFRSADDHYRRRRDDAHAVRQQSDSGEPPVTAGAALPPVHPAAQRAEQHVHVEPDHRLHVQPADAGSIRSWSLAAPVIRARLPATTAAKSAKIVGILWDRPASMDRRSTSRSR